MYPCGKGKGPRWHAPSLQWQHRLLHQERVLMEHVGQIYFLGQAYEQIPAANEWTVYSRHQRGAHVTWAIVKVCQEATDILAGLRRAQQMNECECEFLNWMDVVGINVEDFFGTAEAAFREAYIEHEAHLYQ